MSVAFHRGLSHELRLRMQQAGIKLEEIDAQRALAGLLTREHDMRGNPVKSPENQRAIRSGAAAVLDRAVNEILHDDHRFDLMRQWENDHPGESPFPDSFPDKVISLLQYADEDDLARLVEEVLELARMEQLFG